MLVEALRVLYPETFALVRKQPGLFIDPAANWGTLQPSPSKVKERLEQAFKEQHPNAINILRDLFPDLRAGLNTVLVYRSSEDNRPKGVFRARYFPRYFQYAIPSDDVPDAQVDDFLRLVVESPEKADTFLSSIAPERRAFKFLERVRDVFHTAPSVTRKALVLALARAVPAFEANAFATALVSPMNSSLRLMVETIEQSEADDAQQLARELLDVTSEQFGMSLMARLEGNSRTRAMSSSYSARKEEVLEVLSTHLVSRIEQHRDQLALVMGRDYLRSLRWIAKVKGREAAQSNLVRELKKGGAQIEQFLADLNPALNFDESNYAVLTEVIDPGELITLLDEHFPVAPDGKQDMLNEDEEIHPHDAAIQLVEVIRGFYSEYRQV